VVKYAWDFSCFCFLSSYPAKCEAVEADTIVPAQAPGEEVPGEAGWEALAPEEAEAARVRECEGAVVVVAQDAPINP